MMQPVSPSFFSSALEIVYYGLDHTTEKVQDKRYPVLKSHVPSNDAYRAPKPPPRLAVQDLVDENYLAAGHPKAPSPSRAVRAYLTLVFSHHRLAPHRLRRFSNDLGFPQ
eukprot:8455090-Pyramimonas_sp.AAC.1